MNNKIIIDNRIKLCMQDSRFLFKRLISDPRSNTSILKYTTSKGQLNYEVNDHLGQEVPKDFAKYSCITDSSFVSCHQYR